MGGAVSQKPKLIRKKQKQQQQQYKRNRKRKFPNAINLKYWNDFNITQLGLGRFPTRHDKNNERCSDIRPLSLYIQTNIRTKMYVSMSSYDHITYDQLL